MPDPPRLSNFLESIFIYIYLKVYLVIFYAKFKDNGSFKIDIQSLLITKN